MNYDNHNLIDHLAAEYVLGTLKGPARKRFARLLMTSEYARHATNQWEQHLNALGTQLPHDAPNPQVWQKIQARINNTQNVTAIGHGKSVTKTSTPWFWPTTSAASLAACVLLTILLMLPSEPVDQRFVSDQFALVKDQQQQPLWLIDATDNALLVKANEQLKARQDKDYELWMIVKTQEAPISLGLLPKSGQASLPIPKDFADGNINLLAVSLEPLGGSPTGTPTEVLYTAELVDI